MSESKKKKGSYKIVFAVLTLVIIGVWIHQCSVYKDERYVLERELDENHAELATLLHVMKEKVKMEKETGDRERNLKNARAMLPPQNDAEAFMEEFKGWLAAEGKTLDGFSYETNNLKNHFVWEIKFSVQVDWDPESFAAVLKKSKSQKRIVKWSSDIAEDGSDSGPKNPIIYYTQPYECSSGPGDAQSAKDLEGKDLEDRHESAVWLWSYKRRLAEIEDNISRTSRDISELHEAKVKLDHLKCIKYELEHLIHLIEKLESPKKKKTRKMSPKKVIKGPSQ